MLQSDFYPLWYNKIKICMYYFENYKPPSLHRLPSVSYSYIFKLQELLLFHSGWHLRSSVFCKLSLFVKQRQWWGGRYKSTVCSVRTQVNYLVNGIFSPVLSIENGCLAIDLCPSSLMSADQKPIKNQCCLKGYQIVEGCSWDRWRTEWTSNSKREREIQRETARIN